MVTLINKWFCLSFVACFFSTLPPETISSGDRWEVRSLHPFHVATTEINHNAAGKTLEITCRLFIDDFESCLSKQYHIKADLSAASVKTGMDSVVKKYLVAHLQIRADGKMVTAQYLGFEKEDEAVDVYFEADKISTLKKIEMNNSILHDLYDDQVNIIHVVVNGNRKSTKLDYPNKEATFSF